MATQTKTAEASRAAQFDGGTTEARLAALWKELFGRSVGRTDDFFELGGNSLLGMWLTERIVATFEVHVPARRFYEGPTIADLALAIEELATAGTGVCQGLT